MPCPGRCFSSAPVDDGNPVVHDALTQTGFTWYFCPAHRRYHAMFLFAGAPQPRCGECAVLFFDRAHFAIWYPLVDIDTVMSNSRDTYVTARNQLDTLAHLVDHPRSNTQLFSPPDQVYADPTNEVPKTDLTYTGLGTDLIPHRRISGLSLLSYRTFHGVMA